LASRNPVSRAAISPDILSPAEQSIGRATPAARRFVTIKWISPSERTKIFSTWFLVGAGFSD
jgi:hypothetical protein